MSPFTVAAVGMGVGDGGNGVRVGKTGVAVPAGGSVPPLQPLSRIITTIMARNIFLMLCLSIICVDYKRYPDCSRGKSHFLLNDCIIRKNRPVQNQISLSGIYRRQVFYG